MKLTLNLNDERVRQFCLHTNDELSPDTIKVAEPEIVMNESEAKSLCDWLCQHVYGIYLKKRPSV